jgi:hypothetical protein
VKLSVEDLYAATDADEVRAPAEADARKVLGSGRPELASELWPPRLGKVSHIRRGG